MSTELACLILMALWGFVLVGIEAGPKILSGGLPWAMGNRDTQPPVAPWVQRCGRALNNHKENFPLFATAVVAVLFTGKSDAVTRDAGIAFVAVRILHSLVYIAGIPGLRTILWLAGVAACLAMLSQVI